MFFIKNNSIIYSGDNNGKNNGYENIRTKKD